MIYLWGGSRWLDSGQRAPVVEDDLSFAFCEKYLLYALPVRWQSLTEQWAKGSSLDEDLNFNFCEKYLCYAHYLWGGSHWPDNEQRAGFRIQGTNRPAPLSTSGSTTGSAVDPPEMTSCLSAQWKEGEKGALWKGSLVLCANLFFPNISGYDLYVRLTTQKEGLQALRRWRFFEIGNTNSSARTVRAPSRLVVKIALKLILLLKVHRWRIFNLDS